MNPINIFLDDFSEAVLKTLNSVYIDFKLVKKEDSIYVFGYKKDTYNGEMPKAGGKLDLLYPETDIVIVDKDCVKPFTKKYLTSVKRWKEEFKNNDTLKGFSVGCKIFGNYVESRRNK